MAESLHFAPVALTGKDDENEKQFWRSFEKWIIFKDMQPGMQLTAFPLFLKVWYESLLDGEKDTIEHLKASFAGRYNSQAPSGFRKTYDVWQMRQKFRQSMSDFTGELEVAAGKINVSQKNS